MSVSLDHTIVHSRDKHRSAAFLARILGLDPPVTLGHFVAVETGNGVSLDYDDATDVTPQHYAFLVDDADFDGIRERVEADRVVYFADSGHRRPGEINSRDGGRGFYFSDPDGHNLEVLTRTYDAAA